MDSESRIEAGMAGFKHRMLLDIYAQPDSIAETLRRNREAVERVVEEFFSEEAKLIYLSGSGTSYHAGLASQFILSSLARLPATAIPASEFAAWTPSTMGRGFYLIAISQSGESRDVLDAVRDARRKKMKILAVTNTEGSALTKLADETLLTHAGEEVAVTATKTFTSQLSLLYLLSVRLALKRGFEPDLSETLLRSLLTVPDLLRGNMREMEDECSRLAELYKDKNVYFILGSGPNYATALEGALKLKEACNVFSEGFATREFLHGPVQLVNEKTAVMLILFKTELDEVRRLVKSFKGYGAPVMAVSNDASIKDELKVEALAFKGDVPTYISPIVYVAPLQLYAYFTSIYRGLNPDKPEKLSKVVK